LAPRALPPDAEDILGNFTLIIFVSLGRSLTRGVLKPLIVMLIHDLVAEKVLDRTLFNVKCPSHFMTNFIRRMGWSFRKARPQRRPAIDDIECAQFMANLTAADHRHSPYCLLNFNESNWYLVMANLEHLLSEVQRQSTNT
jgi:hypothetical protein